jgi:phosphatidylserine/phosphatidylglycerophosphate/cardiolipin synthase-like enzyme
LRHPALITALLRKAAEGVNVTLFLEGTPVGISEENEEWQQQLWACRELEARGGRCYFAVHDPDKRVFARYTLIHAKFLVVDDEWAVVSTQNLTQGALPADDRANGTYGSRGVVLATDAPSVVDRLAALFARDCDPANHVDVRRWDTGDDPRYGPPHPDFVPDLRIRDGVTYTVRFTHPLAVSGSMGLELLTAPEAALRRSDALLGLLARAGQGDRVYVEQLYEQESWGDGPNLRLEAYLDAARRGASVRLLLNRGTFDEPYLDRTYTRTLRYVEEVARTEHLDLRAAAGDPTAYGIHNKMVLVWSAGEGAYAHVGSINGSEHSSKLNREVALQVRSPEVVDYLTRVFLTDWHLSNPVRFPFVAVSYKAPDHLLISEVAYGSGTPRDEWVEIYNPTRAPVDLSGFKVGDAEDAARYEGLFAFPPGTVIPPREVLVVAYDASRAREADFELHDYDPQVPDMLKDPLWGTGDWTLRNDGDQVMLLTPGNQPVDVVVWGDAGYPGVVPHPGAPVLTHSLQRHPPEVDSDDCNADFRAFPPSPGELLW